MLEAGEPSPLSCLPSLICKMGHSNILQRLKVKTSSIQAIDPALFPLSGSTYTVLAADRSSQAERKGLHGLRRKENTKSSQTEAWAPKAVGWLHCFIICVFVYCDLGLLDMRKIKPKTHVMETKNSGQE